jgi:hypothetical protein
VKGVPDSPGASLQAFCNFLDRMFGEQFSCCIKFLFVPAAINCLAFDPKLDNESPAFFLPASGLALKAPDKLDKFVP